MELGRREILVGAAATVMGAPLAAAAQARPSQWPGVRSLLNRYVAERQYAGVAAALSYHGAPISFLSAGTLAFDSPVGITPDSLFRLYSLTKAVTGMAAMLLVEDGTIALDQPAADILPELRRMQVAIDPAAGLRSRPAARPMTMRQLITHTSGLSSWQPFLARIPSAPPTGRGDLRRAPMAATTGFPATARRFMACGRWWRGWRQFLSSRSRAPPGIIPWGSTSWAR